MAASRNFSYVHSNNSIAWTGGLLSCWQALGVTTDAPPVAPRRPTTLEQFGDVRVDEYYWLRDREDPDVLAYLKAENSYAAEHLAATSELEQVVYDEIVARIEETDVSAPVRWGPWWYYERTYEGSSYPVHCRCRAEGDAYPSDLDAPGEEVILDENALAEGHVVLLGRRARDRPRPSARRGRRRL